MKAILYQPHHLSSNVDVPTLFESRVSKGTKIAAALGLKKIAENLYECPSSKDLWKVDGNKIIRTSSEEVNNGETLAAADAEAPDVFLAKILEELEF
jgi:hypothetical protein